MFIPLWHCWEIVFPWLLKTPKVHLKMSFWPSKRKKLKSQKLKRWIKLRRTLTTIWEEESPKVRVILSITLALLLLWLEKADALQGWTNIKLSKISCSIDITFIATKAQQSKNRENLRYILTMMNKIVQSISIWSKLQREAKKREYPQLLQNKSWATRGSQRMWSSSTRSLALYSKAIKPEDYSTTTKAWGITVLNSETWSSLSSSFKKKSTISTKSWTSWVMTLSSHLSTTTPSST